MLAARPTASAAVLPVVALACLGSSQAAAQCPESIVLAAPDAASDDSFGAALALDGVRLAVGLPRDTVAGRPRAGSVQLFERAGAGWVSTERLVASDFAAGSEFGRSLALEGERLVVGAPEADVAGVSNAGAVYVFERVGGTWVETARLVAVDPGIEDRLGTAVDLDGDRVAAGAAQDQVGNANFAGSVYLFENGPGGWVETARLVASDGAAIDLFGHSLALGGEDLLVGAYVHDASAGTDSGTVYAFELLGGTWVESARLEASDENPYDRFGFSLAIDGGRALVGAHFHGHRGVDRSGAVYVFEKTPAGWVERAELLSSDPQPHAQFGWDVALFGTQAVVGAPFRDVLARPDAGRVEVFGLSGAGWTPLGTAAASGPEVAGRLGWSVAAGSWGTFAGQIAGDAPGAPDAGTVLAFGLPPCVEAVCGCPAGAPCGNTDPAAGCANSTGVGALLFAPSGAASISAADLVLGVRGAVPGQPGLFFQGAALLGGGAGVPFGDGLRCVGAQVVRLEVAFADAAGEARTSVPIAASGGVLPGNARGYQFWYRDPHGTPCGSGFDLSNALWITWGP